MHAVTIIPTLKDNYAYLLEHSGRVLVVDPGEAEPVLEALSKHNLTLTHILITHHHGDHTAGIPALKAATGAKIIAPAMEADRIPLVDITLNDQEIFTFEGIDIHAIATPGHTMGALCYYAPAIKALFTGDTLFSLGCGRLFEGTAHDLFYSLQKIKSLPPHTEIYCGHEYTLANSVFCLAVRPDNEILHTRIAQARAQRAQNKPTLPVTLETERNTNVFLQAETIEDLAALRTMKSNFR